MSSGCYPATMVGRTIDVPTYASLLEAFTATHNLAGLMVAHARLVVHGASHRDFLRAKLAAAYAVCGRMRDAATIFSWTNKQPTFLHNAMIKGYAACRLYRQAFLSFARIALSARKPDHSTFPAILKACAGSPALQTGRQLHGAVITSGFDSDVAVGNSLVTMYGKCGSLEDARQAFEEMPQRSLVSWSAMVGAYGMHGRGREALRVFEEMRERGQEPDEVVMTTVLAACWHAGLVAEGLEYWEKMAEWGLRRRLQHYTCVMGLLGRQGLSEEARNLLEEMEWEPDSAVIRVQLGICNIKNQAQC